MKCLVVYVSLCFIISVFGPGVPHFRLCVQQMQYTDFACPEIHSPSAHPLPVCGTEVQSKSATPPGAAHVHRRMDREEGPESQRDPKSFAKKNGSQLAHSDDIFSQLATILRSDW